MPPTAPPGPPPSAAAAWAPQPPQPPPPPGAPGGPTPLGLFLARTVKGDWAAALRVAAWPLGLLLVAACALGLWSDDDLDDLDIGWGTRMRVALAALLRGIGGGFGLSSDGTADVGGERVVGAVEVSGLPLLATVLWIGALAVAARVTSRRAIPAGPSAGLEAALRIGVLCGVGGLLLGLYAAPSYEGLELNSAPGLTLLWAFLLSTLVAALVLTRAGTGAVAAAGPGVRIVVGALRTAGLALVCVLALASVVMLVVLLASADEITADDVWGLLVMLPNVGALGLALAWGAPIDVQWDFGSWHTGRESLGYGELSDLAGGWAVVGALAGGLVCALLLGTLVARRSARRGEQLLAAGFFVLGLLLVVAVAGMGFEARFHQASGTAGGGGLGDGGLGGGGLGDGGLGDGGLGDGYGNDSADGFGNDVNPGESVASSAEVGAGIAELLLFALLWSYGGALLVPFLRARFGRGGGPGGPPGADGSVPGVYPAPYGAPAGAPWPPPYAGPQQGAPGGGHPAGDTLAGPLPGGGGPVPPPQRRRGLTWAGLVLAAFLVVGAATGGILHLAGGDGKDGDGTAAAEKSAAGEKSSPSAAPEPGDVNSRAPDPTPSAGASGADAEEGGEGGAGGTPGSPRRTSLPEGFTRADDPEGFSVGVREGWQRAVKGTQVDYEAPGSDDYLRIGVIRNTGQTSYENFRTLEKGAAKRDGYRRLELTANTFRGRPGARWEFVYTSDDTGRTVHAVDQAYVAEDGTEYSIYAESGYDTWDPGREQVFSTALRTWDENGA
ncbi:hypothetical protein ABZ686_10190 [Streptomyces sp. NPDC006992]|uniref:hypothetical protein n=1 Tax=Streptomyces sp. NPDC006992 TaxID=3155601 RepID=UPI0033EAEFD7